MTVTALRIALVAGFVACAVSPASAQRRELQQMAADIRILQEQTEWHRIALWGKMAETLQPYLTKGKQIYLEGRLQTRQWEKEGQKHYTTEVKADKVVLLGGGAGRGGDRGDRGDGGGYNEPMGQPAGAITDDDIPF